MYLLDTNVISELRKTHSGKANPDVVLWAASIPVLSMYISVITIIELEMGILLKARKDKTQGRMLRNWFEQQVLPAFENRILPLDTITARRCAQLHVPDPVSERDAVIAATALVHGLEVVTRNTGDFEQTGVLLANPWKHTETG